MLAVSTTRTRRKFSAAFPPKSSIQIPFQLGITPALDGASLYPGQALRHIGSEPQVILRHAPKASTATPIEPSFAHCSAALS